MSRCSCTLISRFRLVLSCRGTVSEQRPWAQNSFLTALMTPTSRCLCSRICQATRSASSLPDRTLTIRICRRGCAFLSSEGSHYGTTQSGGEWWPHAPLTVRLARRPGPDLSHSSIAIHPRLVSLARLLHSARPRPAGSRGCSTTWRALGCNREGARLAAAPADHRRRRQHNWSAGPHRETPRPPNERGPRGPGATGQFAQPKAPSPLPYRGSCLLYTSPSPRDGLLSRMPSSA